MLERGRREKGREREEGRRKESLFFYLFKMLGEYLKILFFVYF